MRTRRFIGVGLIILSIVSAVAIQLRTGKLITDESTSQITGDGLFKHSVLITRVFGLRVSYAIPLAALAGLGLICILWPPRRPPIINQVKNP